MTFGAERIKRFPDAPTLREVGIDLVVPAPYGIAGPRGLHPEIVSALHDALKEALFDPTHLAVLDQYDMPVLYLGFEDYAVAARRQYEEERDIVRMLGLRME
ncbi:tripartite tricarboxylate transporter substrate-binding protein [Belnapia moabensis]|uniref:tripartite tricarboxylate transporter substrate-binding protein n=1 Tax=Belnapia moabensis TaxID=365533 RepID=UPI002480A8D7|nr:tripartite tricarboxylate transporter substrate-binding protein [Belnapia moabensis]